jgi:hypothetical protein
MRALLVVALFGVGATVFFLSVYEIRGFDQPRGYDTPRYLWRTACVEAGGVHALRTCAPSTQLSLPSRVGYPLESLTLSGTMHTSRVTMAAILPAMFAAAIGLAAASMVVAALRLRSGAFAVVAAIVTASPLVITLAMPEGYADNMIAVAIGVAALVALGEAAATGRGRVAGAVLLGLMAVVHWPTATIIGLAVVVVTVVGLVRPPAGGAAAGRRMAEVLGGAAAVWAVLVLGLIRSPPDSYPSKREVFEAKLRVRIPHLGLPVAVPAAAAGLVALWKGPWRTGVRRWVLGMLLAAWVGVILAAMVAWFLGRDLPAHRFLIEALPLPILGAIAVLWVVDALRSRSRALAWAVAAAACAVVLALGGLFWLRLGGPMMRVKLTLPGAQAGAYLVRLPPGTPVKLVADNPTTTLDILRQNFFVSIPPDRIASVTFRRRPVEPNPTGVYIAARAYSKDFDLFAAQHPEGRIGPDVVIVSGPSPAGTPPVRTVDVLPSGPALVALGLGTFALLMLVGLGWARAALPTLSPLGLAGIAPAVSLGVLVLAGLVGDAVGVRLTPTPATLTTVAAGGLGWIVAAVTGRRAAPIPAGDALSPTIPSC